MQVEARFPACSRSVPAEKHYHFAAVNSICIMKTVAKVQCRKKRHKLHRFCTVSAPFFQKLRQNNKFRACFLNSQRLLIFAKIL